MNPRLQHKVALVTGGAAGIGAAIVRRFVAEGARVLVGDRDQPHGDALCAELGAATAFQGRDGIRINALCPAGVRTETLRQWMKSQPDAAGIDTYLRLPLSLPRVLPRHPLRRQHRRLPALVPTRAHRAGRLARPHARRRRNRDPAQGHEFLRQVYDNLYQEFNPTR